MKAIIYAAGRATRLGKAYASRPKILLEFGGRTLLEWHALRLRQVGVESIFVVTGHEHLQVRALLPALRQRHQIELVDLYNPDYCEGSVLSMHVSLPEIQSAQKSVLLMDGDVLYETALLRALVESRHPSALLIDRSYSDADQDPVLAPIRDGKVIDLAKCWQGQADVLGESVGFFKLDAAHVPQLARETCARLSGAGRLDSLDEVLRALVKQGCFSFEDITGMAWTEIDFPHDIVYAESQILPRLLERSISNC